MTNPTTKTLWLALIVVAALMTASCASKKAATGKGADTALSNTAYMQRLLDNAPDFEHFSAKMRLRASYGGESLSVGGSIRMVKDERIQLSLVAIGIVEAARMEINPKGILVLDRIGRRYIDVKYSDLNFFKQTQVDFYTLQALFRNELFLPGVKHVARGEMDRFALTRTDSTATLTATTDGNRLVCSFLTRLAGAVLQQAGLQMEAKSGKRYGMEWSYNDFTPIGQSNFPLSMEVAMEGTAKPVKATFTFSRFSTTTECDPLTIPSRYKRVEAADILKHILTL